MQRQPQDRQHDQDGPGRVDEGALLHGGEFLVGNRDRSGQPQGRAVLRFEMRIDRRLADRLRGNLARHQGGEIENRPDFHESAPLAGRRFPAVEHRMPREARPPPLDCLVEGVGRPVHQTGEIVERVVLHPRADQPIVERRRQSAQIGVLSQRLDDRLGLAELAGGLDHLLSRQEKQPVLAEKRPAAEFRHRFDQIFLVGQLIDQRGGGLGGEFGARRVDHRQDGLFLHREGLVEGRLALPPGQILRDQLVDVGVDGEIAGRVQPPDDTQKYCQSNDLPSVTGAGIDRGDDCLLQHAMSWELCRPPVGIRRRDWGGEDGREYQAIQYVDND